MKPRYQADGNQGDIVDALRDAGCSVSLIQGANGSAGVPDLLVGRSGRNYVLEVKRPKAKGQQGGVLSDEQRSWLACWRGSAAVVTTADEALRSVGLLPAPTHTHQEGR